MTPFINLPPSIEPGAQFPIKACAGQTAAQMAEAFHEIMAKLGWTNGLPCFRHVMRVSGLASSCRILLDRPQPGSVSYLEPFTPLEMATDLLTEFGRVARFPTEPCSADGGNFDRCLEVRELSFSGFPAVMILAGWMPRTG